MSDKPVIMVVDDEIANIELIAAVLEEDYEIIFARSGEQAIDIARKAMPDLILLDVVMPGLDGYETCRRIKQDPDLADVPVIFTTGLDAVEDEVRGLAAGAIDYVTKPVQPVALRRRGRHVQVGLMLGDDAVAPVPMGRLLAEELEIVGGHGMPARDYPDMLALVAEGRLDVHRLVGRVVPLSAAPDALMAMSQPATTSGMTVVDLSLPG